RGSRDILRAGLDCATKSRSDCRDCETGSRDCQLRLLSSQRVPDAREEFRDDARRSRDVLQAASGRRVVGFRIPQGLRSSSDLWMLDVLAEEKYLYDSSLFRPLPNGHGSRNRTLYQHESNSGKLWEFPHATLNCLKYELPISGGNYFRQIPHTLVK